MQAYEMQHYDTVRALTPDCTVLLKSDGSFPLRVPGLLALYGNGARRTVKGGTGSGDVNVRAYTTVEQGLENAGFTITTKAWLDGYDAVYEQARADFRAGVRRTIEARGLKAILLGVGAVMPEPDYALPLDGAGDTALYVLARVSGEGSDRTPAAGDFALTETEIRTILQLQHQYPRFLLVLNVGGVVDLSPVANQVPNILLLSQPGIAAGDALADMLLGKATPSGKLGATWARWADYPAMGNFGQHDDTRYREGVYVGYRYFDAAGVTPLFPFGFGLSYTTFSITPGALSLDGAVVSLTATVCNTGGRPGKEVVQLYAGLPSVRFDQPPQVLAAFAKTHTLQPGEAQTLTLTFRLSDLATFEAATTASWLEAGTYRLYLGNSSRDTALCGAVTLEGDVCVERLHAVGGTSDFADWKPAPCPADRLPDDLPVVPADPAALTLPPAQVPAPDPAALALARGLSDEELAYLCVGGYRDTGSRSVVGNASMQVAGAAGETTDRLSDRGVPSLTMADGPAGLRIARLCGRDENGVFALDAGSMAETLEMLPPGMRAYLGLDAKKEARGGERYEQNCTAIPIGTALAQSWDPVVAETCGDLVGAEMERFGVDIWLAPAMNIQRLPLCGRNFEYYAEDPLLTGRIAAGLTRGVQKHPGRAVAIKHFCCNNQETNRMHSNSQVSPRALRDLYLKGFRIAIAESAPATVMSSYNLLNGEHTSQRTDLLETLLRGEWGFAGIVMSDWVTTELHDPDNLYPGACASGMIAAGNDIMMPGGPQAHRELVEALAGHPTRYPVSRAQAERCAARVISLAWQLKPNDRRVTEI